MVLRHKAPKTAIIARAAIISQDKQISLGDADRGILPAVRSAIIVINILNPWFIDNLPVDVDPSVLNLDLFAAFGDQTFNKIPLVVSGERKTTMSPLLGSL